MKRAMILTILSAILMLTTFPVHGKAAGQEGEGGPLEKANFAGGVSGARSRPLTAGGVVSVMPGYREAGMKNPTYEEVSSGGTGHAESVQIVYDPSKISYERLLEVFWHNIDPTVKDKQFCDVGNQYRSAIFYHNEEQRKLAEKSKKKLEESKRFAGPIYTEIVPASEFYPAEEYHQKYYKKNPVRYKFYRWNCGRDARLKELWGETGDVHE